MDNIDSDPNTPILIDTTRPDNLFSKVRLTGLDLRIFHKYSRFIVLSFRADV